jgi:hypothetical protein
MSTLQQNVPVLSDEGTTTTSNHCAWCGNPPNEYGSHGICDVHAEALLMDLKWDRLQAVPSYIERFRKEEDR